MKKQIVAVLVVVALVFCFSAPSSAWWLSNTVVAKVAVISTGDAMVTVVTDAGAGSEFPNCLLRYFACYY